MNQRVQIVAFQAREANAFDREARKETRSKEIRKAHEEKSRIEFRMLSAISMRNLGDDRSGNRCMDFISSDSPKLLMPPRRLNDRIRDLCARAVTAEGSDLDAILSTLKLELHEHTTRIRKLAAQKLAVGLNTRRYKSPSA
jgi:hypothetical protein